jgi:hypothetical protein
MSSMDSQMQDTTIMHPCTYEFWFTQGTYRIFKQVRECCRKRCCGRIPQGLERFNVNVARSSDALSDARNVR